jgi:hypothetical protein
MQSAGDKNPVKNLAWRDVRHLVSQGSPIQERKQLKTWTSGVKALSRLSALESDSLDSEYGTSLPVSFAGICRFRSVALTQEPARRSEHDHLLEFGELYTVLGESPGKRYFNIKTAGGREGWIDAARHLGLTQGEYKVLSGVRRKRRASFLVNFLADEHHTGLSLLWR